MTTIASFAAFDLRGFVKLRKLNKDWQDAIDNFSIDVWQRLLTYDDIIRIFCVRSLFMIDFLCRGLTNDHFKALKWSIASMLIMNSYQPIDDIMVRYGHVNIVEKESCIFFDKSKRTTTHCETPLIYACKSKNHDRIRFLLANGASSDLAPRPKHQPLLVFLEECPVDPDDDFLQTLEMFLATNPTFTLFYLDIAAESPIVFKRFLDYYNAIGEPGGLPYRQDIFGTVLGWIIRKPTPLECIQLILREGANINDDILINAHLDHINALDNILLLVEKGAKLKNTQAYEIFIDRLKKMKVRQSQEVGKNRKIIRLLTHNQTTTDRLPNADRIPTTYSAPNADR